MDHQLLARNILSILLEPEVKNALLLLAPPSWGKTKLVEFLWSQNMEQRFESQTQILGKNNYFKRFIFIAPTRALTEEVAQKVKHWPLAKVFCPRTYQAVAAYTGENFIIVTPEMWQSFEKKNYVNELDLIMVDEFHLIDLWEDFRWVLRELWYSLANCRSAQFHLSATINKEMLSTDDSSKYWISHFSNFYILDVGNFTLLHRPHTQLFFTENLRFLFFLWFKFYMLFLARGGTVLLFVSYRSQIDAWLRWARKNKLIALGCKGGEVMTFCENLAHTPKIDLIVSTTVLSHGVNLPPLKSIFISMPRASMEFLVQMVGRAGRRGEKFSLYMLLSFKKQKMLRQCFKKMVPSMSEAARNRT